MVGGSPGTVQLYFTAVPFAVTFQESGLPAATNWSVNVSGELRHSMTDEINFSETSGDHSFTVGTVNGYAAMPTSGSVTVASAPPADVVIAFSSTLTFRATFHESGLPSGRGWSVGIGSQFQSSLTSNVTLVEPNGTFGYVIQAVSGYTTTYSGYLNVSGHDVVVPVRFLPQTYPVIVVALGLPNGTNWSITVTGSLAGFNATYDSNGSVIIVYLPNGTYSFSVRVPAGFTAILSSPTFTVAGTAVTGPAVRISSGNPAHGGTSSGAPWGSALDWGLLGLAVLAFAVVGLLAARGRSRPPRP